jgi:hypothetical protein
LRGSAQRNVAIWGTGQQYFYSAGETIFHLWGRWDCEIDADASPEGFNKLAEVHFCVERTGPNEVLLNFDGKSSLTVNADDTCSSVAVTSFLGDTGDAARRDRDDFDLAGDSGEQLHITLDRDGTDGGAGEAATLEVESEFGDKLARQTGELPLELDVTIADAAVVLTVASAPVGSGEPYRGGYVLSVQPAEEVGDRLLRPHTNVEP